MNQIDYDIYEQRHMFIGKASFVIALVGMILFIVGIILAFLVPFASIFLIYLIYPAQILTTLGLLFGAISYFGPFKLKYGLVGFIIALVTLCLIPIMTIAISFGYMYIIGRVY